MSGYGKTGFGNNEIKLMYETGFASSTANQNTKILFGDRFPMTS